MLFNPNVILNKFVIKKPKQLKTPKPVRRVYNRKD
jgi:hypothetical protein